MKKLNILLACAVATFTGASAVAQTPADNHPTILLSARSTTLGYNDTTFHVNVLSNVDYTVTPAADWVTVTKKDRKVVLHATMNTAASSRSTTVTFTSPDGTVQRTYSISQERENTAESLMGASDALFADDMWTTLKEGTTQADIDALENPFSKLLAQRIFDNEYTTRWRVASYPAKLNPSVLSERWKAPGKLYDQMDGPTGINITKGKTAVLVKGIPEGVTVRLRVVAWFAQNLDADGVGGGPASIDYTLKNGRNIIEYNSNFDGLAYVCYYVNDDPKNYPAIDVHFVNAQINGYLHPELSNEEMHQICADATNTCMDVYGSRVHSVWTSEGLYKYCKASDGVSIGYRQYMNVLDSLVAWEHRLLGFEKYNSVPDNRTMAYVNYTYYMFQGGWGVSFMYNQERRVLNCKTLMYNDDDAIWGLSHEWGHLHQMHPYLCWAGTAEITNNLNSYYNIMHMGYYRSDKINNWEPARENFIYNRTARSGDGSLRKNAYDNADIFSFSNELREQCLKMKEYSNITRYPAANGPDSAYAISFFECGAGQGLCPFIMLYNWATLTQGDEDFGPDMYEALRQTEAENGSVIEKQNGIDKYELLACAQNSNKNGAWGKYKEKYPESCWVQGSYITESQCNWQLNSAPAVLNWIRKCSRLTGYNLFPYFEAWGFLRQVAIRCDDYGWKNFVLTEKAYKEFKADMDALVESGELQVMPEGLVRTISTTRDLNQQNSILFPTPNIPN